MRSARIVSACLCLAVAGSCSADRRAEEAKSEAPPAASPAKTTPPTPAQAVLVESEDDLRGPEVVDGLSTAPARALKLEAQLAGAADGTAVGDSAQPPADLKASGAAAPDAPSSPEPEPDPRPVSPPPPPPAPSTATSESIAESKPRPNKSRRRAAERSAPSSAERDEDLDDQVGDARAGPKELSTVTTSKDEAAARAPVKALGKFSKARLQASTSLGPRLITARDATQFVLPESSTWNVTVAGALARVEAEYVFVVKQGGVQRATFSHPLAADAVVVDMAVWDQGDRPRRTKTGSVDFKNDTNAGAWIPRSQAQLLPVRTAQKVFAESLDKSQAPAMLAVGEGASFRIDVSRVVPGRALKVVFAWQMPLLTEPDSSRLQLRFPSDGPSTSVTARVDEPPALVTAAAWTKTKTADGHTELTASASAGSTMDIVVRGTAARFGPVESGLEGQAFFTRVDPQVLGPADTATGHAVFVVDTSRSVADPTAAALRARLLEALLKDPSLKSYAVVLFDVQARWLHGPGFRNPDPQSIKQTVTELARVELEGATDLDVAFTALGARWIRERPDARVFFLSDGNATWGSNTADEALARHPHLAAHRIFSYRFAGASDRVDVLQGLAEASGGQVISVGSHDQVSAAAKAHRTQGARLVSVVVPGAKNLVVVGKPVQLHPGQVLTITGRAKPDAQLELTLEQNGKRRVVRQKLARRSSDLVPLSWAATLAKSWRGRGVRFDNVALELARHYGFASEHAAFVLAASGSVAAVNIASLVSRFSELTSPGPTARGDRARLSKAAQSALTPLRALDDRPAQQSPLRWEPTAGGHSRHLAESRYDRDNPAFATHFAMARIRADAGDSLGAMRALSTAVEMDPLDPQALRSVAYGLLALRRPHTAVRVLKKLQKQNGRNARTLYELGLACEAAGLVAAAGQTWELGLARPSSLSPVFGRSLVRLYAQHEALGPAVARRRAVLAKKYPSSPLELIALSTGRGTHVDLHVVSSRGVCNPSQCSLGIRHDAQEVGLSSFYGAQPRDIGYDVLVTHGGSTSAAPSQASFVFLVQRQGDRVRHSLRLLENKGQAWLLSTIRPE